AENLLDQGADPNRANASADTPLLVAATRGDLAMVRLLLDRGAAVNQANRNGHTPLLRAAYGGHDDVAFLLLERGADPLAAGQVAAISQLALPSGQRQVGDPVERRAVTDTTAPSAEVPPTSPPLVAAAAVGDDAIVYALLLPRAPADSGGPPGVSA